MLRRPLAVCACAALLAAAPAVVGRDHPATDRERPATQDFDHPAIWVRDGRPTEKGRLLLAAFETAADDGLNPEDYRVAAPAQPGGRMEAGLERRLAAAYVRYAHDLRFGRETPGTIYADPGLRPRWPGRAAVLREAAAVKDFRSHLAGLRAPNPVYVRFRAALREYRTHWGALPAVRIATGPPLARGHAGPRVRSLRVRLGLPAEESFDLQTAARVSAFQAAHALPVTGTVDGATLEALNIAPAKRLETLRRNLDRARELPRELGESFVWVDIARQRLEFVRDGRSTLTSRVIVGRTGSPTPRMAGRLTRATFDPHWYVPADLARGIARRVAREGPGLLQREGFEVLSDWSDGARPVELNHAAWTAVAAGQRRIALRQKPGPGNMMGAVKLTFPNQQGIYLHDTPAVDLFARPERLFSAGCIRVEHADKLARQLAAMAAQGRGDRRIDLGEGVPIYLTYFTAWPTDEGMRFGSDPYGLDRGGDAAVAGRGR